MNVPLNGSSLPKANITTRYVRKFRKLKSFFHLVRRDRKLAIVSAKNYALSWILVLTPIQITNYVRQRDIFPHIRSQDSWVLSRVACLGNDVWEELNLTRRGWKRINLAKCRADLFLTLLSGRYPKKPSNSAQVYLDRADIWPNIIEQNYIRWIGLKPPEFILFDSFSELTDQKFLIVKDSAEFYCNYSDLKRTFLDEGVIVSEELLSLEELEKLYEDLFCALWKLWPNVDIFFIHFPSQLETRQLFRDRANRILQAVTRLGKKYTLLISIVVPHEIVERPAVETSNLLNFPYHYSSATKSFCADIIRQYPKSLIPAKKTP